MRSEGDVGKVIYNVATRLVGASGRIKESKEVYRVGMEDLVGSLEAYGGISKLEDDSNRFATELRKSEESLKNDLGGRSFFKKEMDIGKYWSTEALEEFGDFEGVVGTNYGKFIGDVYARLDKKGDVLVSPKRRLKIGEEIFLKGLYGVIGVVGGGILGTVYEGVVKTVSAMGRVTTKPGSNAIIAGAVVGGVGAVAFVHYAMRGKIFFDTTNPLSTGANDLEKRVGVIREALGK